MVLSQDAGLERRQREGKVQVVLEPEPLVVALLLAEQSEVGIEFFPSFSSFRHFHFLWQRKPGSRQWGEPAKPVFLIYTLTMAARRYRLSDYRERRDGRGAGPLYGQRRTYEEELVCPIPRELIQFHVVDAANKAHSY